MAKPAKALRILVIVNLPWDSRLGAPRVWMELAEQWRADGHVVDRFSLSDAFPGVRASRITFALRQLVFVRKAAAFVRKNGHRYDIIDALIGTLPFSKEELNFRGIIVARSVGLYRLYERFERSVQERWPRPTQGKLIGRVLYRFTRERLLQASETAVRQADLINVPNDEEAECLRTEIGVRHPIIVEPYGLSGARRDALTKAACPPEVRLACKRVAFIGMWSARKGAHDWAGIIRRVRAEVPEAQFRFLGTMIGRDAIEADLGSGIDGVEFISDYQPDELPSLLADCTVGAFPSYVEGFGLAVIEQLAAGLPTVAYDTAGPRDILRPKLPQLLVESGAVDSFGAAICNVLLLDSGSYAALTRHSIDVAAGFSWPQIARDTLVAYERHLADAARPIVFVQPFSIGSAGGGARILRALLGEAPFAWRSVCSSPRCPKAWRNETHLPTRPSWGRIEHSRLAALPRLFGQLFGRRFKQRLKDHCVAAKARAIHAVPHGGLDFAQAQSVARELSLPFFISLHDDLAYTANGLARAGKREAAMAHAWKDADARFVISDSLGDEYCRRYGARDYHVVTDGVTHLTAPRTNPDPHRLRIYFMGLFHMGYERNLRALLDGLALLQRATPSINISVTLRCEYVRPQVIAGTIPVTILPFSDEAQVERDMEEADLLYMPLPFGGEHENFARHSLSTKMVTYVGSGVPIIYHGPTTSAAFDLLSRNRAAVLIPTLAPAEIATALSGLTIETRTAMARNAHELGRRHFMLADQAQRFWGTITEHVAHA